MSTKTHHRWFAGPLLPLALLACGARSALEEDGNRASSSSSSGGQGGLGGLGGSSSTLGGFGGSSNTFSGGSGVGGGPVDPVCPPVDFGFCEAPESCFLGPAEVAGKGSCTVGERGCSAGGAGRYACTGQVLPRPDSCQSPTSWTCDDAPHPCHPLLDLTVSPDAVRDLAIVDDQTYFMTDGSEVMRFEGGIEVWALTPDDSQSGSMSSVAVDSTGAVLVGGQSDEGAYVMKVSALGETIWRRDLLSFGSPDDEDGLILALSTAPDGSLFVAGTSEQGFEPLDGIELAAGDFVAKFSGDGTLQWSRPEAVTGLDTFTVEARADGSVVAGGSGEAPCGGFGPKIVALDASGELLWTWAARDAGHAGLSVDYGLSGDTWHLEVDPGGKVYGVGRLDSDGLAAVDFGDGIPKTGLTFVVGLDAAGGHRWSHNFTTSGSQYAIAGALTRASNGHLVWATHIPNQSVLRTFAPDGTMLWERQIHSNTTAPPMRLWSVEAFPDGRILLGGQAGGPAQFPQLTLEGQWFKASFGP